jgi:copper(I)-binding protein
MVPCKYIRTGLSGALWAAACVMLSGCIPEPAVRIVSAVAPATPPGVDVAAVYMEIVASADDVLLEIATPLAQRTEIHETGESAGMLQMRPVASVVLKAGKPLRFAPGGMHLMLMNLHKPLLVDHSFPLDLHLQNAGIVTAEVQVVPPGAIALAH